MRLPGIGRAKRLLRLVLGPSTPVPDADLPRASGVLSASLTLPSSSSTRPSKRNCSIDLDASLHSTLIRANRIVPLIYLLVPVILLWCMANVLLVREQYYSPSSPPIVGCTAAPWGSWPPDTCGVNGTACNEALGWGDGGQTRRYRCAGGCRDTTLGNPRWIGAEEINGVPLVVGGQDGFYRADSWICASAIHFGLINPTLGGCISLNYLPFPTWRPYPSDSSGTSHGVPSTPFPALFPGGYSLSSSPGGGCLSLHPIHTATNAAVLFLSTLLLRPSPPVLVSILVLLGYIQIVLITNPRYTPPDWEWFVGGLPAVLIAGYCMYRVAFKRTLAGFTDRPIERALWQGIGFWIGVEQSNIFARLPITRLGYGALGADGVVALIVIVVIVAILVLRQAWDLRKYGMLRYYLYRYLPLVPVMLVLNYIPGYTIRLHHYLYAIVAIPVLSLPNRVSLAGQAFMLGIFLDGVGRWGWDGLIERTTSLIGDAAQGTPLPQFALNVSTASVLAWQAIPGALAEQGVASFQVVVDDVLRAQEYNASALSLDSVFGAGTAGEAGAWAERGGWEGVRHTVRIAYVANGVTQDFTDPVLRLTDGTWVVP